MPSSDHLQESVRPSEGPAAWAPVTLEGAQVLGCALGSVGPREGSQGRKGGRTREDRESAFPADSRIVCSQGGSVRKVQD